MAGRRGQRSELRDAPVKFLMFIMAGWQGSLRQLVHYSVILLTSIIAGRPARTRYARDGLPHRPPSPDSWSAAILAYSCLFLPHQGDFIVQWRR
jgi:hypothetical protein